MDIMNTITTLLNNNLDIEPEQVTEDSTFDSLGIDSLDMVELICDLEDECGIEFGNRRRPDQLHRGPAGIMGQ